MPLKIKKKQNVVDDDDVIVFVWNFLDCIFITGNFNFL